MMLRKQPVYNDFVDTFDVVIWIGKQVALSTAMLIKRWSLCYVS